MKVFGDWANRYQKSGLNVIPCNGKRPVIENWSQYCQNNIPPEVLTQWEKSYGNLNIGLPLGPACGIVGFDLDYDFDKEWTEKSKLTLEQFNDVKTKVLAEQDEIKKQIIAMLPPSPCVKIGKDGKWCYFYRPKGAFQSTGVDRYGIRLFDILWDGKQTILPPSIHPDTKKPYRWINGDLTKHAQDLPELDWELVLKIKEKFEKKIEFAEGQKQIAGRNDLLKKSVFGMFRRGLTIEACVGHIVDIDKEKNSPPLFTDKDEYPKTYMSPETAAASFVKSNHRSFKEMLLKEKPERKKDEGYEQLGFYYRYIVMQKDGSEKEIDVPQYSLMADHCFDSKNMCFDDSTSLRFDGKKWQWLSKNELNNFIITENKECIKPAHIDNFVKMIRGRCHIGALGVELPEALVNVDNGVIDVKTGNLLPHDYKYMFKYCAPVEFNALAECPSWEKFLMTVFEGKIELIDLAQRLFGYILIGGKPFLHRAFVLFGSGRNGKSTFLDVLRAVVGRESYSVVSMAKLDKEFSIVNIDGKLANIVEETPTDEINSEVFKAMVGGGEIQAAHKGFDEYTFRCQARFVFACNEMPVFRDKSIGLEERLVFIPFMRYFAEEERDTEITEKLLSELTGILNWAVQGAKLILKDRKLPNYEVTKDAKELYRIETDPMYAWFREEIEVNAGSEIVTAKDLYEYYKIDCDENGNKPYSKDRFSKRLRTILREKCNEKKIRLDEEMKTPDRSSRAFDVITLRRIRTSGTGENKKVSQKFPSYIKD